MYLFNYRSADSVGLPKLDKPFIRTSAKITVFHLKKFLSKKLNVKSANEVTLNHQLLEEVPTSNTYHR